MIHITKIEENIISFLIFLPDIFTGCILGNNKYHVTVCSNAKIKATTVIIKFKLPLNKNE
jgi:translation elongation factor EF-4